MKALIFACVVLCASAASAHHGRNFSQFRGECIHGQAFAVAPQAYYVPAQQFNGGHCSQNFQGFNGGYGGQAFFVPRRQFRRFERFEAVPVNSGNGTVIQRGLFNFAR